MSHSFIAHRAKFLDLVRDGAIPASLKSFNDTVLFYYLGDLALRSGHGDIMEIGIGGSTWPLHELSDRHRRSLVLVDHNQTYLDAVAHGTWFDSTPDPHLADSLTQPCLQSQLAYCHVDGDKNYETTCSDLEYCVQNLARNGIICQDDYGNNKWPSVTDAVHRMVQHGKLMFVMIGDSSAWLTVPESHASWTSRLRCDREFQALAHLMGITTSSMLDRDPEYFFLNHAVPPFVKCDLDQALIQYWNVLIDYSHHSDYLQIPYVKQSQTGRELRMHPKLKLNLVWSQVSDPSWGDAPTTVQDVERLPESIKQELIDLHHIDIYEQIAVVGDEVYNP